MEEPKRTGAVSLKIATNACRSLPSSLVCFFKGLRTGQTGLRTGQTGFPHLSLLNIKQTRHPKTND